MISKCEKKGAMPARFVITSLVTKRAGIAAPFVTLVIKRAATGPNSRLLLNLIPGHPFTMFSISLYDDNRRKEASQKGICEFFLPIEHLLRPLVCGYPRGTGKGL